MICSLVMTKKKVELGLFRGHLTWKLSSLWILMWLGCEIDTLSIAQYYAAVCLLTEGDLFGIQYFLAR